MISFLQRLITPVPLVGQKTLDEIHKSLQLIEISANGMRMSMRYEDRHELAEIIEQETRQVMKILENK